MVPIAWHTLELDTLLQRLRSSASGLSSDEARRRLDEVGPNTLPEGHHPSPWMMFARQFADLMVIVLLAAALISGVVGEPQDTVAILVIVLLNALISTLQEFRAERAITALRTMAAPTCQALRDGGQVILDPVRLVPGDVVLLESGDRVPADLRLLASERMEADESALTGESHPVGKREQARPAADCPLGDRANMVITGSLITRGRGRGVVVATAQATELGKIAALLQGAARTRTPLQVRLARFSRYLAAAVLLICCVVFLAGLLQGQPLVLMFLTAVSLAVAAIPEALPAVVTISLTFGARTLSRHHALVRNLPAVETLGSVTYICSDKTGTLTENRMTAERFFAAGVEAGAFPETSDEPWQQLGVAMALNNDVTMADGRPVGEPTELALFEAARRFGFDKSQLLSQMPRAAALPFDSGRKAMTTLHRSGEGVVAYTKGAPERILAGSVCALGAGGEQPLSSPELLAAAEALAAQGYRVLAYARRAYQLLPNTLEPERVEAGLTFLGLVALIDPPRAEVPRAVQECLSAGITPVMITGDHPGTALAIARRLGIASEQRDLLTGSELTHLSDAELSIQVERLRVYARVSPEQKLRIVKALQANGEFVAMTGDGVNDAPALKRAGIGIAMGLKGTDVAREAADMVLLDDDFSTIVRAVKAGRRIFDNIRKFIRYTMSSNAGEIWTLFLAPFFGLPIPLLPIHILWINLVTDGLPGLAFTAEPAEPNIMQRPPRPPGENIFAHGMWQYIIWVGLLIGGVSIASQAWAIARGVDYWQTVVFTVLTLSQLFHALAVRSEGASLFSIGLLSNRPMLGAVTLTLLLQLAVIYLPTMNTLFHTQPLPLIDLLGCLLASSLVLVAVEVQKWRGHRRTLTP